MPASQKKHDQKPNGWNKHDDKKELLEELVEFVEEDDEWQGVRDNNGTSPSNIRTQTSKLLTDTAKS